MREGRRGVVQKLHISRRIVWHKTGPVGIGGRLFNYGREVEDVFAWFQHDSVLTASQQVVKLAVGLNNAQAALHFSGWVLLAGLRVVLDHDTSLDRLQIGRGAGR